MIRTDWSARAHVEGSRQWPALEALVRRASNSEAIVGVIVLGSLAAGTNDAVSDVDAVAIAAPGRLEDAWADRLALAAEALVAWEPPTGWQPAIRWLNWLTRDVVKVECGFADPSADELFLAEPAAVVLGDPGLRGRFTALSPAGVAAERRRIAAANVVPDQVDEMPYGELIDWKLSELKAAVRRGIRSQLNAG